MQLIDFKSAENLFFKYKIPCAKAIFVVSKKEALSAVKKIKYPAFLKVYGKNILHRTELGGVKEVFSQAELVREFLKMQKIKGIEGIIVQEKIDGKSLIIGMKRDPQFGPVIMAGIGGIFAEVVRDFTLRIAPVSGKEALKMLEELKGYDYLLGKRDKKPINFKAISKIIVALSEISLKEEKIMEADLNPVIADAKRAVAVDFKFIK